MKKTFKMILISLMVLSTVALIFLKVDGTLDIDWAIAFSPIIIVMIVSLIGFVIEFILFAVGGKKSK